MWLALAAAASLLAGAVATVSGFGIGSLLTPILAARTGMRLAVAAVAVPHVVGTALRFWMLRAHVDRRLLWRFGLLSGAGGLVGALLQERAASPALTAVFGGLLVFAGITGLTGWAERMRFKGWMAWVAGALSGLLGGLVGNQGGIRSAAMLGFEVPKEAFVATATAVALMVDGARLPVYLLGHGEAISRLWPFLSVASAGVLVGTAVGGRVLSRVPERAFRRIVSAIVLMLGLATLARWHPAPAAGRARIAPFQASLLVGANDPCSERSDGCSRHPRVVPPSVTSRCSPSWRSPLRPRRATPGAATTGPARAIPLR